MAYTLPASEIKLYVWPGLWDLPSYDSSSLSAILYLQLTIPGKFSVTECTDPDLSPSGQLPFLVHEQEVVLLYPSIVRYVAGLAHSDKPAYPNADADSFLSAATRSQRNAWLAHVEAQLGNLVASALFSSEDNWEGLTLKALAKLFPVPQKYYVPTKLREAYQPRLEAAGLWSHLPPVEERKKTPFERELRKNPAVDKRKFRQTFVREKVVAKAKPILDVYDRLLGDNIYIFENRITSLDVALAARILLLTKPPYPDTTFEDLITISYPNLVAHAHRVQEQVLNSNAPPMKMERHSYSLWSLIPPTPFSFRSSHDRRAEEKTDEEKHIDRMRWGFVGLMVGAVCAYLAIIGPSRISILRQSAFGGDDGDEEEEDGEVFGESGVDGTDEL